MCACGRRINKHEIRAAAAAAHRVCRAARKKKKKKNSSMKLLLHRNMLVVDDGMHSRFMPLSLACIVHSVRVWCR